MKLSQLKSWWRRRQRAIDVRILWPAMKTAADGDVEQARGLFYLHCMKDRAWSDFRQAEIIGIVEGLN